MSSFWSKNPRMQAKINQICALIDKRVAVRNPAIETAVVDLSTAGENTSVLLSSIFSQNLDKKNLWMKTNCLKLLLHLKFYTWQPSSTMILSMIRLSDEGKKPFKVNLGKMSLFILGTYYSPSF